MRRARSNPSFAPIVAVLAAIGSWACGNDPEAMLATAQFEEVQQNPDHARELYERLVREHPGTPEAATAAERLRALAPAD